MTEIVIHQLLVAGSFLLSAIPVGCSWGFPGVLLHQLKSNDSSIQVEWETTSWIGAANGIAAIPSILMPAFMQWRGRKITFILGCLVGIIGWIIAYSATSATTILISEFIHGFGSHSIIAVGMLSMSEMLSPQMRHIAMGSYVVIQSLGMALVGIIGSYLHWKTITLIVCAPLVIVTVMVATIWSESPAWLANKGEFDKCAKAFTRLRGTSDAASTELEELILAQKEILTRDNKRNKRHVLKWFWQTLKSRDFYLPATHIFVLFVAMYWIGSLAILIYSADIIPRATFMKEGVLFGTISFNITILVGCLTSIVLVRYYKPKLILFASGLCGIALLVSASGVNYSQSVGFMTQVSYICLYLLIGFMYVIHLSVPIISTVSSELMPVKHRGIGGPLSVVINSICHTSVLKILPYLIKYIELWGTLLVFAVMGVTSHIYVWKCVPETKGRTLQQIEDFYMCGNIDKRRKIDQQETLLSQ